MAAGEIGDVRHVNCYMGSPLASLFNDPNAGGWVKPTGAAGMNGFGWGQLSHTLAWTFQVSGLCTRTRTHTWGLALTSAWSNLPGEWSGAG